MAPDSIEKRVKGLVIDQDDDSYSISFSGIVWWVPVNGKVEAVSTTIPEKKITYKDSLGILRSIPIK